MSESFTFEQLQSWMQMALVRRDIPAAGACALVNDSSRLSAEQHLGIYRRGYIARLRECMKNQFSALNYALGDKLFRMFADEYLGANPSVSYTLSELGRKFPDFLEATRPTDTGETWPDFMIELARFEFALSGIFDQSAEEAELAPGDVPDSELVLVPIFYLFRHRYPVCRYYLDATRKKKPELPFEQESFCAVTRNNYRLGLTELRKGQYLFLERIKAGFSVDEAKECLIKQHRFERGKLEAIWPGWRRGFLKAGFFRRRAGRTT